MNPFDLPGPQFLLFYTILAGIVLGVLLFWRRRAELSAAPARIDLSDPYLIAYLRGGKTEVLRVAKHSTSDHASLMLETDGLNKACESYDKTLRRAQLLPDAYVTRARFVRLAYAIVLLGGVAVIKIFLALSAGRTNVGFLIILTVIAIVFASVISFPRLTESGKAMIEDVKSLYSGLRGGAVSLNTGGPAVEPMMMAAVFGVGALSTYGLDQQFAESRKKKADGSCSSDPGCGSDSSSSSSCSGGSSSCSSGSSCGGGSGCGGGCGGCGGS